jgi:hypothetical protein
MTDRTRWVLLWVAIVMAYFVAYPGDAKAVAEPVATFLELTNAVSPWFYIVIAVAILAFAIIKTWGPRRTDVG